MNALTLTPLGRQAAENTQGRGAEFAVLSALYEANGPMDFEEIMEVLHSDEVKASMLIRSLINEGKVKEI